MLVQGFLPFNNCCCRPMMMAPTFVMPTSVFVQQSFMPFVPFTPVMPYQFGLMNVFQNAFQNIWNARQTAPKPTNNFLNLTKKTTARRKVDTASAQPIKTVKKVEKQELPTLSEVNYNSKKGNALVQDAMSHRRTTPLRKGETGRCAAYVKEAIQRTGLGEYISGHAYQCGDIMAQNDNFREIKVSGKDLKNLPAGCVVVYPQNDVYNRAYGHILITKGDGSSISQFASDTTKASDKARVFVPV